MDRFPTLETTRLLLRKFTLADAKEVQHLAGDRRIAEMTTNIPHPYLDGMAETWIATHEEAFRARKGISFAVTIKPNTAAVGAIGLHDMVESHQAELGYWISVPYWGHGFCTEAGMAVLDYAFSVLGLERVHASHFARNPSSGRVMQKLGMVWEGRRRSHVSKWGTLDDLVLYGILKDEWLKLDRGEIVTRGDING